MTLKDELPRSVGAKNATGEEQRNTSGKNEEMEPKRKQRPVVDVTGDGVKNNAVKNNISQEPGMLGPSVQFSSVVQLCLTLCDPMDCSMPGFPVHHQPLELT